MMKARWIVFIALALIVGSCNAQDKQTKTNNLNDLEKAPREDIVVNKEYDEDGKLLRYDSSYTYYYSNIENDSLLGDSILKRFRTLFDKEYLFSSRPLFNDLFFEDSLLKYDFYKEDFFTERFRRNMEHSEKMFQEMDSLKNKFFGEQFFKK